MLSPPRPAELADRILARISTQARAQSMRARDLMTQLHARTLAIDASGTPLQLTLLCDGERLHVSRAAAADARIIGTPLHLLGLLKADAREHIQRGDVRIEGDAEIAQQFQELLQLCRPDLEQSLAALLGHSGAHLALRALRGAADWTRAAGANAVQNLAEYLSHERGDLVPRAEAEQYLRGVEQLRDTLDRLDARVQHLERTPGSR